MIQSTSLVFPFKKDEANNSLQRATTVEETISSAIKLFLITPKYSRPGNTIGCFLTELINTLVPTNAFPALENQLKQELSSQFSGVTFTKVALLRNDTTPTNLHVQIQFYTAYSNITDFTISIIK